MGHPPHASCTPDGTPTPKSGCPIGQGRVGVPSATIGQGRVGVPSAKARVGVPSATKSGCPIGQDQKSGCPIGQEDPVDQAFGEWLESQGRNPFFEVAVPDAAMRLVQACGRLIRHEEDHGRITLLDRRIVTARYGSALLQSLPSYRLEVGR